MGQAQTVARRVTACAVYAVPRECSIPGRMIPFDAVQLLKRAGRLINMKWQG